MSAIFGLDVHSVTYWMMPRFGFCICVCKSVISTHRTGNTIKPYLYLNLYLYIYISFQTLSPDKTTFLNGRLDLTNKTVMQTTLQNVLYWLKTSVFFIETEVRSVGPFDNTSQLLQMMAWCQTGNSSLSEMMVIFYTNSYMRHGARKCSQLKLIILCIRR